MHLNILLCLYCVQLKNVSQPGLNHRIPILIVAINGNGATASDWLPANNGIHRSRIQQIFFQCIWADAELTYLLLYSVSKTHSCSRRPTCTGDVFNMTLIIIALLKQKSLHYSYILTYELYSFPYWTLNFS